MRKHPDPQKAGTKGLGSSSVVGCASINLHSTCFCNKVESTSVPFRTQIVDFCTWNVWVCLSHCKVQGVRMGRSTQFFWGSAISCFTLPPILMGFVSKMDPSEAQSLSLFTFHFHGPNEPLKKNPPRPMGPMKSGLLKNSQKTILTKQGSIIPILAETTRFFSRFESAWIFVPEIPSALDFRFETLLWGLAKKLSLSRRSQVQQFLKDSKVCPNQA